MGKAKKLVTDAIKNSLKIGAGHGPVNALFKYLKIKKLSKTRILYMEQQMTQLEKARQGLITEEMKICAAEEGVDAEYIRQGLVDGTIVVVRNVKHAAIKPLAIGKGLRTKVNANIGTSKDHTDLNLELEKLKIAAVAGADAVMDLSTGGDLAEIRKAVMRKSPVAIGTVPIYQAAVENVAGKESYFRDDRGGHV